MGKQASFWDHERMRLDEALDLTAATLTEYITRRPHVVVGYSGGKDSSTVVTTLMHLIDTGRVPRPASLRVVYADTRMELPPLQVSAVGVLAALEQRGISTQIVQPRLDKRFFVMMFGRGVPPSHNGLRWCTGAIKIEPMEGVFEQHAVRLGLGAWTWDAKREREVYAPHGANKLLLLTGVRLGESAARDGRIALSCSRNGAECGQGWFAEETPAYTKLAPCIHWRVCTVWDWLQFHAPALGFPTGILAQVYGGDEKEELNARTGCIQCPVAHKDLALTAVLKLPEWGYLAPLTGLLPLYAELSQPHYRLRKTAEYLGPLTMEARRHGLTTVLGIQDAVNAAARRLGHPEISLISPEELARIEELIVANTWPHKWTGTEPRGDAPVDWLNKRGSAQAWLLTEVSR